MEFRMWQKLLSRNTRMYITSESRYCEVSCVHAIACCTSVTHQISTWPCMHDASSMSRFFRSHSKIFILNHSNKSARKVLVGKNLN